MILISRAGNANENITLVHYVTGLVITRAYSSTRIYSNACVKTSVYAQERNIAV